MSVSPTLYSSDSGEWQTPQALFDAASRRWGTFTLDAAASGGNALCTAFFSRDGINAFTNRWWGRVWLNPPYGREIGKWIDRAAVEVAVGNAERVVCLIPARTDTRWWQQIVKPKASEVHFLAGRVSFKQADGKVGPAPFPSAIVVFEREFSYDRAAKT